MHYTRQGPIRRNAWVPPILLLLLGGLLVLEAQAPLPPWGRPIVQLVLALLAYGVFRLWLRCNRGALVHKAYEQERAQKCARPFRQQMRVPAMHDDEPWDDAWPPWHSNGHDTDMQRRQ
jgi:hypothetical protein